DQRPACPTLDKRDFVGANDVNYQRLGEERFHEPAGVEQGGGMPAVEYIQHHEECQVIEDRADRTNEKNETLNLANGPLARPGQPVRIHFVGGDCGLREVVQQIVGQHLDWQHG